jgi:hypothetical protein
VKLSSTHVFEYQVNVVRVRGSTGGMKSDNVIVRAKGYPENKLNVVSSRTKKKGIDAPLTKNHTDLEGQERIATRQVKILHLFTC